MFFFWAEWKASRRLVLPTRLFVWSQLCCLTSDPWIYALKSPLRAPPDRDGRRWRAAGAPRGREAKPPPRARWPFCPSRWRNWAPAGGRWSGAAMHAGCRKRNAVEGRAAATGSEASRLWALPGADRDPRPPRSPPARCRLAEGSGPWLSAGPAPLPIGWAAVASSEETGTALGLSTNRWQDKKVITTLDWTQQHMQELAWTFGVR